MGTKLRKTVNDTNNKQASDILDNVATMESLMNLLLQIRKALEPYHTILQVDIDIANMLNETVNDTSNDHAKDVHDNVDIIEGTDEIGVED